MVGMLNALYAINACVQQEGNDDIPTEASAYCTCPTKWDVFATWMMCT